MGLDWRGTLGFDHWVPVDYKGSSGISNCGKRVDFRTLDVGKIRGVVRGLLKIVRVHSRCVESKNSRLVWDRSREVGREEWQCRVHVSSRRLITA